MNARISLSRKSALVLAVGALTALLVQGFSINAIAQDDPASVTNDPPVMLADGATEVQEPAPATTTPAPAPTLSDLKLTGGAAQIVKLAQAGVGEDVMLAYIGTMTAKFNLGSDQIIYLNDIGVSGTVIKAMIQRDATLDDISRAAVAAATQPPSPVNVPQPGEDGSLPPPPMDNSGAVNPPDVPDYANVPPGDYSATDDADYFYTSLSPYGSWVSIAGTGLCWQPTVSIRNHDWRPYCDRGRWIYSNFGWYWQSDYSWGWGPFHYGRWLDDPKRGWVWQPDRTWGPAWVSWRRSADYCGWAPLPPGTHFVPGVGIQPGPRSVGTGYEFGLRSHLYTFIPIERMTDYTPGRYSISAAKHSEVFAQSTPINKITVENRHVVNHGLDPKDVAAAAGTAVRHAQIQELSASASRGVPSDRLAKHGDSLVIYRPQLPTPSASRPANATGVPKVLSNPPAKNPGAFKSSQNEFMPGTQQNGLTASTPANSAHVPNLILSGAQNSSAQTETYPPDALIVLARKNATQAQPVYSGPVPNMKLQRPAPADTPFVYQTSLMPGQSANEPIAPSANSQAQSYWPNTSPGIPVQSHWNSRPQTVPGAAPASATPEYFNLSGNPVLEHHNGWQGSRPFDDVSQSGSQPLIRPGPPERPVTTAHPVDLIQQVRNGAESHPAPARPAYQPPAESPRPVPVAAPAPVHPSAPPPSHVEAPHSSPPPAPAPAPAASSSSSSSSHK